MKGAMKGSEQSSDGGLEPDSANKEAEAAKETAANLSTPRRRRWSPSASWPTGCPSTSLVARFLHVDYCHLRLSLLLTSLCQPSLASAAAWHRSVAHTSASRRLALIGSRAQFANVARYEVEAGTVEQAAAAAVARGDAWLLAGCRELREEMGACPRTCWTPWWWRRCPGTART